MPECHDKRGKIFPDREERILKYYEEILLITACALFLAIVVIQEVKIENLENRFVMMKKNLGDIALNSLKDSIRISKLENNKDLNFTNGTVDYKLIVNDASKYENMSNDCKLKRDRFLINPQQGYFECNGAVTIKTGNATYHDSNGNSITVNYGFNLLNSRVEPSNQTIKIVSWKKCWQEYPMEKEVCVTG